MANIKSAEKKNRQRLRRRARNLYHLGTMRTQVKKVRSALEDIEAKTVAQTAEVLLSAIKGIDKAAQRGAIKKTTAARKKSRLQLAFNAASAAAR